MPLVQFYFYSIPLLTYSKPVHVLILGSLRIPAGFVQF